MKSHLSSEHQIYLSQRQHAHCRLPCYTEDIFRLLRDTKGSARARSRHSAHFDALSLLTSVLTCCVSITSNAASSSISISSETPASASCSLVLPGLLLLAASCLPRRRSSSALLSLDPPSAAACEKKKGQIHQRHRRDAGSSAMVASRLEARHVASS